MARWGQDRNQFAGLWPVVLLYVVVLAAGALLGGLVAWAVAGRVAGLVLGTASCIAVGAGVAQGARGGRAAPLPALGAAATVGVVLRLFAGPLPVVAIAVADLGLVVHLRRGRNRRKAGPAPTVPGHVHPSRELVVTPGMKIVPAHRRPDQDGGVGGR